MKKNYLFALFLMACFPHSMLAQWNGDPAIADNPVSTDVTSVEAFKSVTDGNGGTIVIWQAYHSIYAQRKSATGSLRWPTAISPVVVVSANTTININDIIPDGYGGAYISWQNYYDDSTADVYLQRITNNGSLSFTANAIQVNSSHMHYHSESKLCADANGVIVTWTDKIINSQPTTPPFSSAQVFARRFNLAGISQWTSSGVQVSIAPGMKRRPEIISDGNNGAFICFTDHRNTTTDAFGNYDNLDIYAQHLSNTGSRLWGVNDAIVSVQPFNQSVYSDDLPLPRKSMVTDSAGGFIIVYADNQGNNDDNPNLFAQRLNNNGNILFAAAGVPVSGALPGYKTYVHLANDGASGVVAAWADYDEGSGFVRAQRITAVGAVSWGTNGVVVSPAADKDFNRTRTSMTTDGTGNYIVTWRQSDFNNKSTVKAQKLNNAGILQWAVAGINVCTNPQASPWAPDITNSAGNAIITWQDSRNLTAAGNDIYAAKINIDGILITTVAIYLF